MDFAFSDEQERFRKEVRDYLEDELKSGHFETQDDACRAMEGFSPEFSRRIAQKGWIGLTWPKEYGGGGRSYIDRNILCEELLRYGAPTCYHYFEDRQIGPSLILFGSEEQKKQFLPKLLKAEISFCLGISEPNAGSDVASIQTRAEEHGDEYVINGQKIWTSYAQRADWCWLVVRTDPKVPKHKGLSQFVVDMKLPGITVRPVITMDGEHHLNEIYFDDVHVPKDCLVGEKNKGFYQIAAHIDYERSDLDRLMSNYPLFMDVLEYVNDVEQDSPPLAKNIAVRQNLAELWIEFQIGRLLCYRVAWMLDQGKPVNYESAVTRTFCAEFEQRVAETAMELLGSYGQLMPGSHRARLKGRVARNRLFSVSYTLGGGTVEIMRNIIATSGLGLPKA